LYNTSLLCGTLAEESLFSYRRDGTTGRQAAVVWMP
jgi:copper oxidase (laccase) domain-containing protein